MSRKEEEKARHEYTLMEMRLMGEDIKSDNRQLLAELCDKQISPLEKRTSSLEHWRTSIAGGFAVVLAYLKYGPHK